MKRINPIWRAYTSIPPDQIQLVYNGTVIYNGCGDGSCVYDGYAIHSKVLIEKELFCIQIQIRLIRSNPSFTKREFPATMPQIGNNFFVKIGAKSIIRLSPFIALNGESELIQFPTDLRLLNIDPFFFV